MSELIKTLLFALGLLIVVGIIVSSVVRRQISGFFATVAREEREAEEAREREAAEGKSTAEAGNAEIQDKETQEQGL